MCSGSFPSAEYDISSLLSVGISSKRESKSDSESESMFYGATICMW